MCFNQSQPKIETPAPAPPSPEPLPTEGDIAAARRQQDNTQYGSSTPDLRIERPDVTGASSPGGAGVKI